MAVEKPWWASLESRLFTTYKTRLEKAVKEKFPKLYCTASPMTKAASQFPTAYFRMVDWIEQGNDLDNTDTNAILATIQVDVITNTSLNDCKEVVYETTNIMKALSFSIIAMPIYSANNNLYTGVIRFRRMIGGSDSF